jgi:LuxR family maltose regulon positive regulatory protein
VATLRASYWLRVGDFGQARRYAVEALTLEYGPWRAIAANCLGTASYWLDDTATARGHLEETVRLGRELIPLVAIFALGLLALIASEQDDWNTVATHVRDAHELVDAGGLDEYWATAAIALAEGLSAERGDDLERAESSIARSIVLYRRGQAPVETANALLHLARVNARSGLYAVARDQVDEANALVAACPDAGPRIARLIALAKRRRHHLHLPRRRHVAPGDELSDRELAVLRLLATDLTQREIGQELYVSLNTVKSHTKSIFRKLGVSTREQAVASARELELI